MRTTLGRWVGRWVGSWGCQRKLEQGEQQLPGGKSVAPVSTKALLLKRGCHGSPKNLSSASQLLYTSLLPSHFQCHYLGHQQQQVGRGKGESGHVKEDVGEWEFRPGHSCHSRLYREGTTCQQSEGRGAENSTSSYPQPQYKSHLHNCRLGEWGRFLHNICSLATPLPFYFQQAPHMNLEKSNDLLKHDKCFPNGESHWYWLSSSVADP